VKRASSSLEHASFKGRRRGRGAKAGRVASSGTGRKGKRVRRNNCYPWPSGLATEKLSTHARFERGRWQRTYAFIQDPKGPGERGGNQSWRATSEQEGERGGRERRTGKTRPYTIQWVRNKEKNVGFTGENLRASSARRTPGLSRNSQITKGELERGTVLRKTGQRTRGPPSLRHRESAALQEPSRKDRL